MEVILSLIFAAMIGCLVWVGTDTPFIGIISTVVVFIICLGLFAREEKIDLKKWNNGMCPACEIEWEFVNVSGMYADSYSWICPNCNKIITLSDQY